MPSALSTECSQGAQASTFWLQCFTLSCTTVSFYKIRPCVHNPACHEAFICKLHLESSVTCQTLLGLEEASKSKPQLVSPMFKGMEGRSMHVIGIIKNGYNPTEHFESIFSHQLSWSFGVLLAFSNSVLCLSTRMPVCQCTCER